VKKLFLKGAKFFIIVGMNCIFIYIFFHVGTANILWKILNPFSELLFSRAGPFTAATISGIAVWAALWYLCYWLYKNRIFIKI
jgi:hypothetical protein